MGLQLVSPHVALKESYCAYIEELGEEVRYPYPMDLDYSDFPALIERLSNYSRGINLPEGFVPNTTYWLVQANELIGVSHLRHHLNHVLRKHGGHIGLGIRPGLRGKGYGKDLLSRTIEKAKEIGIEEIHIHCHKSNFVSAKLIQSTGATLSSEISEPATGKIVQRYVLRHT